MATMNGLISCILAAAAGMCFVGGISILWGGKRQ